ncbi:MAG TPA: S41 family peptidase [Planctomycetota bacterium]|nr:S41 family peptidase [Planctomycetota bacterium]
MLGPRDNDYRDKSTGGFTKVFDRIVEPKKGRPAFRGKVAVLIGPHNMSSCESFILMMRESGRSRLFGERTQGSSGNPKPVELGNGVTVFLSSWRDMLPDGTMIEGRGIAPDEVVKADARTLKKGDPVLEAALRWLRG